jgi:hypothetical protein
MLSTDMVDFSPRHSMILEDEPQNLLSSMQNSRWGGKSLLESSIAGDAHRLTDMLAQAAEEEED